MTNMGEQRDGTAETHALLNNTVCFQHSYLYLYSTRLVRNNNYIEAILGI